MSKTNKSGIHGNVNEIMYACKTVETTGQGASLFVVI